MWRRPLRSTARHSSPRFHPSPAALTPTRRPPLATLCLACRPPRQVAPPVKIIHSTGPECLASKRPLGSNLTIFAIRICPPSAKLAGQRSSWRSRTPAVPRCVFLSVQDFRTPDSSMISAPRPDLYKQAPEPLSSPSIRSVHGNHAFCTRRVENACSPGQDQAAIGTRG